MATTSNESLSELERRAETTRAELAQTVDALHNRVSPSAIKNDVKSYVRDNPLQAAAIAVGAAYPVWRMISAMPAPVLLIGAGLAMANRKGSSSAYRSRLFGEVGNGSASGSNAGGMMDSLKQKASDLTAQVTGKAQETMENVRSMASDTASRTTETLSSTYDSTRQTASDTIQQVSDRASETYYRASESLAEVIERHPLLVGGAAFAIGSIVASAVPVSRQEERLMGGTADEIRRRSQDLARQGLQQAKDVVQHVYEDASEAVRQEGLTPEAARKAARSAVETAREAMETTTGGPGRS